MSAERFVIIGIFGPIFVIYQVYLIKIAKMRLVQMHDKKNVSLNVLNVWIYKTLLYALYIQIIITSYSSLIIIWCSADENVNRGNYDNFNFLVKNQWISTTVVTCLKAVQNLFWNCAYYFQFLEWLSILLMIRFEQKMNLQKIIYRSNDTVDDQISNYNK